MINYIVMFLGIIVVLISLMLIYIERIKGEDIYFNLDVKEQEMKKVMEDADELISELNYTSDTVVKTIEDKINAINIISQELKYKDSEFNKNDVKNSHTKAFIYKKSNKSYNEEDYKAVDDEANNSKEETNVEIIDNKSDKIVRYFKQGYSIDDIAKQMNIGKGEVQLILSLKSENRKNE